MRTLLLRIILIFNMNETFYVDGGGTQFSDVIVGGNSDAWVKIMLITEHVKERPVTSI